MIHIAYWEIHYGRKVICHIIAIDLVQQEWNILARIILEASNVEAIGGTLDDCLCIKAKDLELGKRSRVLYCWSLRDEQTSRIVVHGLEKVAPAIVVVFQIGIIVASIPCPPIIS